MLKIFWADISALEPDSIDIPISDYRRIKLEKTKNPLRKKQGLGAEMLLIEAMKSVAPGVKPPFEIGKGEFDKPFFSDIPLCFSLSHSGDFAACALCDAEVGIDIEHGAKYNPRLADKYYCAEEKRMLEGARDKDRAFRQIWTAKESALKLLGTGLGGSLFSVNLQSENEISVKDENTCFYLTRMEQETLSLCVCTQRYEEAEVNFIEF